MRGRQPSVGDWRVLCEYVRAEYLKVCPPHNHRVIAYPGTFLIREVAEKSGVSRANICRLVDQREPASPYTLFGLARFLGIRIVMQRTAPLPKPPTITEEEEYKYGIRSRRSRTRSGTRRRDRSRSRRR